MHQTRDPATAFLSASGAQGPRRNHRQSRVVLDAILKSAPATRQTALFAATLPPRILSIVERHLRNPVRVSIARERTPAGAMPRIRQTAYIVARAHKPSALGRILDIESPASAIIFCRTRIEVDELVGVMNAHGYAPYARVKC